MTALEGRTLHDCHWCTGKFVRARTVEKGRSIPFDPQPSAAGTHALFTGELKMLMARFVPVAERPDHRELYALHHTTCPGARRARSRRQTRRRS